MKIKLKTVAIIAVSFVSNAILSQTNEDVNPKGKWFFGVEIGTNKISSIALGEPKISFEAGVLSEFYFARHWSLSGRIKYFETGVSFYKPNTHSGGWFDLGSDESFGNFNGAVIALPINIKWEFRINKNFGGSLKTGVGYTLETKSEYGRYSSNQKTNFPKEYGSFNTGYGLNYFINNKTAVYLDLEYFVGQSKGFSDGFFGRNYYATENSLINFGIKYNFKKQNK